MARLDTPSGKDVRQLSFMLSLVRLVAREKMPYGILSTRLCSMLMEDTVVNCEGPPTG